MRRASVLWTISPLFLFSNVAILKVHAWGLWARHEKATVIDTIRYSDRAQELYAQISLGTPRQKLWMRPTMTEGVKTIALIARSDLDARNCSDEDIYDSVCFWTDITGFYSPNKSSTFFDVSGDPELGPDNEVWRYGANDDSTFVDLNWATETFEIGGESIPKVYFNIGTNYTGSDATFSLAPEEDAQNPSFLSTLYNLGRIKQKSFSIYMNDYAANHSQVYFGAVDRAKYTGPLITLDAFNKTRDLIQAQDIVYFNGLTNSGTASSYNHTVKLEPTKQKISIKPKLGLVNFITQSLNAFRRGGAYYVAACSQRDTSQTLTLRFDSSPRPLEISIPISQLLIPDINSSGDQLTLANGNQSCRLLIDELDDSDAYDVRLGIPFARAAYLVLDYTNRQYSIAKAATNASKSDLVMLEPGGVPETPGLDHERTLDTPGYLDVDEKGRGTNVGAIVGGTVAGSLAIVILAALGWRLMRRRRWRGPPPKSSGYKSELPAPPPPPPPPQELHSYAAHGYTRSQPSGPKWELP